MKLPAKLIAPSLAGVYARKRLFLLMDKAMHSPVIWISSPAGAGKTTLVSSYLAARSIQPFWYQIDEGDGDISGFFHYLRVMLNTIAPGRRPPPPLTPEYFVDLAVYVRNFFRSFFQKLPSRGVLVFDDRQNLPLDRPVHGLLPLIFSEIIPGVHVIILSRSEAPENLSRLCLAKKVSRLDWNVLALTREESVEFCGRQGKDKALSGDMTLRAIDQANGWIAGLVLLLENTGVGNLDNSGDPAKTFGYFAAEIFMGLDSLERNFLLRTCILSPVNHEVAATITGNSQAKHILENMVQRNFFILKQDSQNYEYHALFRSFLLDQAIKVLPPDEIRDMRLAAAEQLIASGDSETAIALLIQAQNWREATTLIVGHAETLLEQGRAHTLAGWCRALPQAIMMENPCVLYWMGICYLPVDQPTARTYLQKAYDCFEANGDKDALHLTWSGMVDSYIIEWDQFSPLRPWLDKYRTLTRASQPSGDVETKCLFSYVTAQLYCDPDLPGLDAQLDKIVSVLEQGAGRWFLAAASLAYSSLWIRRLEASSRLIRILENYTAKNEIPHQALVLWKLVQSLEALFTKSPRQSIQFAEDGLSLADQHGIRIYDDLLAGQYILGQLLSGNRQKAAAAAARYLPAVTGSGGRASFILYNIATVSLHEGRLEKARGEMEKCCQFGINSGFPFGDPMNGFPCAVIDAKLGRYGEALDSLAEIRARNHCANSPMVRFCDELAEANIRLQHGENDLVLKCLAKSFKAARLDGRIMLPSWQTREEASILLNMALQAGIETEYVHELIERLRLCAPDGCDTGCWPYPVKVRTFGHFQLEVARATAPVRPQYKPLELLKVLIALGAEKIPLHLIMDTLWDDAEGDAARKVFDTTLYRLRKILGRDDILRLEHGTLSINKRLCWLDTWAIRDELDHLRTCLKSKSVDAGQICALTEKILNEYRGTFLADDASAYWTIAPRENFHTQILECVLKAGSCLEECDAALAVEFYNRALRFDPLVEHFYQRLIHLHLIGGRHAESRVVFERCRQTLGELLRIEPSAATLAMLKDIMLNQTTN